MALRLPAGVVDWRFADDGFWVVSDDALQVSVVVGVADGLPLSTPARAGVVYGVPSWSVRPGGPIRPTWLAACEAGIYRISPAAAGWPGPDARIARQDTACQRLIRGQPVIAGEVASGQASFALDAWSLVWGRSVIVRGQPLDVGDGLDDAVAVSPLSSRWGEGAVIVVDPAHDTMSGATTPRRLTVLSVDLATRQVSRPSQVLRLPRGERPSMLSDGRAVAIAAGGQSLWFPGEGGPRILAGTAVALVDGLAIVDRVTGLDVVDDHGSVVAQLPRSERLRAGTSALGLVWAEERQDVVGLWWPGEAGARRLHTGRGLQLVSADRRGVVVVDAAGQVDALSSDGSRLRVVEGATQVRAVAAVGGSQALAVARGTDETSLLRLDAGGVEQLAERVERVERDGTEQALAAETTDATGARVILGGDWRALR
ncbi:MAG: hypothetical protein H6706_13435 [Myxococcales bacterium]|nr:hypothetical protein [Myxococcales bacterium]